MSGADDDDDEVRKLREVHSAFRAMPDEEPPQRGLAELMAAARVKAEAMTVKPAPWWRVLFRPPMLALATVMVLVGGAVLIGRHSDSMKAESPTAPVGNGRDQSDLSLDKGPAVGSATGATTTTTKSLDTATDRPDEEKQGQRDGDATAKAGNGEAANRTVITTPPPAQPTKPPTAQLAGSGSPGSGNAAPVPRPVEHAAHRPAPDHAPVVPRSETAPPPPPPAPPKIDPPSTTTGISAGGASAADTKDKAAQDDAADGARKKDDAKKEAAPAPAPPPEVSSERRGAPHEPSIDQLVRQCQAAATRGDCTAAKSIAARIKKANDEAYRARVVKDAAIAKCLE
jgi:hypothetical protein